MGNPAVKIVLKSVVWPTSSCCERPADGLLSTGCTIALAIVSNEVKQKLKTCRNVDGLVEVLLT